MTSAFIKHFTKRGLRRLNLDIRRGRHVNSADFLAMRQVDVVLDVGADRGQFGRELPTNGYRGAIISFEPIGSVFRDLSATAKRDGNWQAHHLALGAAAGRALLNVSRASVYSSILCQSPAAQRFDAAAVVARQEEVTVARLDDLFAPFRSQTVFPKIDTQEYERSILEGVREALSQVVGVQLELPLVHLYKDTWSLADALVYLGDAGFVLAQLNPVSYLMEDPVSAVEIDGVFRRRRANE